MAISTFEVVGMILLAIILGIAIWWYVIADNYRKYLNAGAYSRGANASSAGQTLHLTCDEDKEICVYQATQICTDPDRNNFENSDTDPFASGLTGNNSYGDYDSSTTVDMTISLGTECNGKQNCLYKFDPAQWPVGMPTCNGDTQLISTYVCGAKGSACQNYSNLNYS